MLLLGGIKAGLGFFVEGEALHPSRMLLTLRLWYHRRLCEGSALHPSRRTVKLV
jgi:hypothetical protein